MPAANNLYIGVMSGTSLDGVDIVIIEFIQNKLQIIQSDFNPYTVKLREKIQNIDLNNTGQLNDELGMLYAKCINLSLKNSRLKPNQIKAIGLHGQTVDHQPNANPPYSLQIGNARTVSHETGICTVADFRSKDILAGGQGAPLAPAFHAQYFKDQTKNTIVLNLGGIANITYIPADKNLNIIGFDTGPANCLLDDWIEKKSGTKYDKDGAWAKSGKINQNLLNQMLEDKYFHQLPPKSTGREYFNLKWLNRFNINEIPSEDVQATLVELTAQTIAKAINTYSADEVFICGGGIHNKYLIKSLAENLKPIVVKSTADKGIDPDMVEALAFAWLAKQTLNGKTGNLPSVTGAKEKVVLGEVYKV